MPFSGGRSVTVPFILRIDRAVHSIEPRASGDAGCADTLRTSPSAAIMDTRAEPPLRHEGQRDARRRDDAERNSRIDEGLHREQRPHADADDLPGGVPAHDRDAEAA
jgi:hypothetical protein